MSNWPYDPKPPQFPWYQPPVTPNPPAPSLAGLIRPAPKLDTTFLAGLLKPTRPRIFVSYQHSSDQYYYNLFSQTLHETYETVYDNSLRDEVDSDDPEYIIQRIRDDFITGTSCTIVLVGPTSYQRRYIDWEIKATLDKEHGLIGLQLPNVIPDYYGMVLVPTRFKANIDSAYGLWQGFTWSQVIENPAILPQLIQTAVSRSKTLIRNPKEIKKQNG